MKTKSLFLLLLAAVLSFTAPRAARADADVTFDYFYDTLLPYGEWIEVGEYGLCWRPTGVDEDWTPYSDGYWTFTDAGWTWVSYEDFGGIVYHYGRWVKVEDEGWVWVPDYDWAPAWVSWRSSDDYIGWAPLPPRARWRSEVGFSVWVDTVCDIGPAFYSFCRVRDFGAPVLRPVIIARTRNVTIIRNTVNVTNITFTNFAGAPLIYNGGPSYARISSRSEHPVPALRLVRETDFNWRDVPEARRGRTFNPQPRGNQLAVLAPVVAPPAQPREFTDRVKKVIAAGKTTTGWGMVKDEKVRDDLRQRMGRETKGLTPETAPAKPVAAAELKVLPASADPTAATPLRTTRGGKIRGETPTPVVTAPPAVTTAPAVNPAAALPDANKAADVEKMDREKGRSRPGRDVAPSAVTGVPLKPFNSGNPNAPATNNAAPVVTVPEQIKTPDARGAGWDRGSARGGKPGTAEATAVAPAVTEAVPRGISREAIPATPAVDSDAAAKAKAAADAAASERADFEKQKAMEAAKLRAAQAEAARINAEKERAARQRDADVAAMAAQQKQAAEKLQADQQRAAQAEAEKARAMAIQRQAEDAKRQQAEARRAAEKLQAEQQHAAQVEAEKARAMAAQRQAEDARRQQAEAKQRAAADAARQQQIAIEQQKVAQQAAAREAEMQRRQQEQMARQQAAKQQELEARRQQAEAQHAAQVQAAQQQQAAAAAAAAQQQQQQGNARHGKDKDKDKDKQGN
jgi:hypothetical protein